MTNTLLYVLGAVLILPLVPAVILYKFLPSRTNVSGPFKGLDLKLTGAFAGYFLLVLCSLAVFFPLLKNEQQQRIDELERKLKAAMPTTVNYKITGSVLSTIPEQTKVFFDDEMPPMAPTGDFELTKRSLIRDDGKAPAPKWICVYNKSDGYKVININRATNPPDIAELDVRFDDSLHTISIGKPIDIRSKEKDSLKYVSNFIKLNPELLKTVQRVNPGLLEKAAKLDLQSVKVMTPAHN